MHEDLAYEKNRYRRQKYKSRRRPIRLYLSYYIVRIILSQLKLIKSIKMTTERDKCHDKLTHNDDTFECYNCNKKYHYYCNGISDISFKKCQKIPNRDLHVFHAKTL